ARTARAAPRATTSTWPSAFSVVSARKAARRIRSSRRTCTNTTAKSAATCTTPRTCCWPWVTATSRRSRPAALPTRLTVDAGTPTMSFDTVLFYLLAIVLVVAAFRVITATSPVTGVLHLILTFFTASMMWMLLQAEFLALVLVIVYVGAVMVLFLFVVMMLDMRTEGLKQGLKVYLPLGLTICGIVVLEMAFVLLRSWGDAPALPVPADDFDNTLALG